MDEKHGILTRSEHSRTEPYPVCQSQLAVTIDSQLRQASGHRQSGQDPIRVSIKVWI